MILSASRRTDIPACYGEWMLRRLREGEVLCSNPFRPDRCTRLRLSPETVEAIVFWTKNPAPMLPLLPALERMGYRYYFTYTLNGYGADWEPGLPPLEERIACFRALSERLGPDRVDWRYDPVILAGERGIGWHLERFAALCSELEGLTGRCIFSFFDDYRHLRGRFTPPDEGRMLALAEGFARVAGPHRLPLYTCAEKIDLRRFGIAHAACIDPAKLERLTGKPMPAGKDTGQRPCCRCAPSIDVGAYDTCVNGCVYCYGTRSSARARARYHAHNPGCPLLGGPVPAGARIVERPEKSGGARQLSLFE